MDDLRLILLLIGAAVVLGIYAWSRFQTRPWRQQSRRTAPSKQRTESPDEAVIQQELQRMQQAMSDEDVVAEAPPRPAAAVEELEELLVISVVAADDQPFSGEALRKAFANNDLSFGDKSIFHRLVRQRGEDVSVFGVANMFKPGDFGSGDLSQFATQGITLFLELPAPVDGLEAFDDFVHTAERLAVELGGQLRDRKHGLITHQALMQKREILASSRLRTPLAS
jgi:cell division protein ZipA